MRIEENLITIETAELAKQKGFELSDAQYNYSEENNYNLGLNVYTEEDLLKYKIYPAPTQALLQRWLRDKRNLSVNIFLIKNSVKKIWSYEIESLNTDLFIENENITNIDENTYEEALEDGLQEALMLL